MGNLIIAPLNLVEDDIIYIRVISGNQLGDSAPSPINFSQVVVTVPAKPLLEQDTSNTSTDYITL
jgi:hypothetical protein